MATSFYIKARARKQNGQKSRQICIRELSRLYHKYAQTYGTGYCLPFV